MAGKPTDVRPIATALYFLPVETRVPLKFGTETLTSVTCARVSMTVAGDRGRVAEGWGETPLSVQWVWPSAIAYEGRHQALKEFCAALARAWAAFPATGHPMEVGHAFLEKRLPGLLEAFNRERGATAETAGTAGAGRVGQTGGAGQGSRQGSRAATGPRRGTGVPRPATGPRAWGGPRGGTGRASEVEPMPWLAALVCCSAFDLALHDAYGALHGLPVYQTYTDQFMSADLARFLTPAEGADVSFTGHYPAEYLVRPPPAVLPAWHLVGGKDPLDEADLDGTEPDDGYPVLLRDWIRRDGLKCLKVKLRGDDTAWDYDRLVQVGQIAVEEGVAWLTSDFNCTVTDPAYVNAILDRLLVEQPRIYGMLLYVEQPFPYELEQHRIDVHSVAARKPLFMDESAHDWRLVRLGRTLGWTGVALKTCKTQTGALLSLCWAKAHGMTLMVQDLTNPMLAQIPHVLLAAHAGTIMGVETNSMQFYPEASRPEAAVHPGLYTRRRGCIDLSTVRGPGFGYRLPEIHRELPPPAAAFG